MLSDDIKPLQFYSKANDGGESLVISCFAGKVSINIGKPRESGGGFLYNNGLTLDGVHLLKKAMDIVKNGQPGGQQVLVFQKFEPEVKKFQLTSSIIFGKDEKQVYYFEVQFKDKEGNARTIRFNQSIAATVTLGGDGLSAPEKSTARVAALYHWLNNDAPTAMLLTAQKWNGNKGGGGYNKSASAAKPATEFSGDSAAF